MIVNIVCAFGGLVVGCIIGWVARWTVGEVGP